MTTNDFPPTPLPDTGPLSWVIGEIRETLGRSKTALFQAGGRALEERATSLQHAKSHLHQAHGALQMVDIDGAALITEVAELALERFKDGTLDCSVEHAQTVANLYQALVEYLEELLSGAPSQPVRLFPYYRAVQEMLGADRIHPADLFFPNLAAPAAIALAVPTSAPNYPAWRQKFEKALLPFLKSGDPVAQRGHAGVLQEAITLVADAQQEAAARTFWCAMQSFAELVAGGALACSLNVKQLFGLINLQMRRLAQGTAALPEGMLRDALFFVAAVQQATPGAQQLRRAFRLDGQVPPDFERLRYGQQNPEALARAKQALAQAKASWDRQAATESDPALDSDFAPALARAAQETDTLKVVALSTLLRQLGRIAVRAGRSPSLDMEMATALLFSDYGLEQIRRLPDDFAANAETIGARLQALVDGQTPPAPAQWQGELSRQIEQDQTVAVLASEMNAGLRQVERVLDEYDGDPSKRPTLGQIDPLLHQLQGALSMLDQEPARRAALQVNEAVRRLAQSHADPVNDPKALDEIAQNIGALGFFVDMLGRNVNAARERFQFDEANGTFRAISFEKIAAADPVPVLDQEMVPAPGALPAPPAAATDAAVDAELLAIFIAEAQEVLSLVVATLAAPRSDGASQDNLTVLRRSFHTLKGSGRMVGLSQFADASAAVERVLNVWLSDGRPVTAPLLTLLDRAASDASLWVAELAAAGASGRSADALVEAALRVQHGAAFEMNEEVVGAVDELIVAKPELVAAPAPPSGNVIEFPSAPNPARDDNLKRVGELDISLPLYNIYLAETDELVRLLGQDFSEWRHEPQRPVSTEALHAAHTLTGTSGTVGFTALGELAHALETTIEECVPPAPALNEKQSGLLERVIERVRLMLQDFALGELAPAQPDLVAALRLLRAQLACAPAAAPPAPPEPGLWPAAAGALTGLDDLFTATYDSIVGPFAPVAPAAPVLEASPAGADGGAVGDAFDATLSDAFGVPALTQIEAPSLLASAPGVASNADTEQLDADLLPVFLEEGSDLLPQIGQALRAWQQEPADSGHARSLLRVLHTVKGSARMAGAMRLGQQVHDIETHVENMVHAGSATAHAFDALLAEYDHALLLFEQLQLPLALPPEDAAVASAAPAALPAAPVRAPMVRVRADILDRLVSAAGEVSISRSKLENEVGTLRSVLFDFSENVTRLRRQLREVEMQAESQIASRMAISSEREFDPLEFDRFTRLQELTRMMAESVDDVASFHEHLTRSVDHASADLVLQARLTRDLQRDLMRVRMVPFSSIGERLFRVARQSAKEVGKRVNLDIRGSTVEIDRSVLERMAAPFEHLLRNAIVHGIEPRAQRGLAGKNDIGELLVQISQQGNEVVIEFSDDGAGLDLERIRAKALNCGLLGPDQQISSAQAAELIFEPGFSTAASLTELAGRGVGMDIVRSEAQALGGRVDTVSRPGQGVLFTIHLPLTLAVTQVVLLSSGGKIYALPSILVEQVLQMKETALREAEAGGFVQSQGQQVALHYLSTLLGDAHALAPSQRSYPVMLLKSGNDRLALQVDEVLGNREVVIKNIGPQLSRMVGICGATVLGSGAIVLLLDPVALSDHLQLHPTPHAQVAAAAASGERAQQVVMVVDDSLTVRRVTQRLLEREGYQVLLAKDGVDALEQLQTTRPCLMLVDIEMPRMDGFDLTRNVRGDLRTRDIPIIMITSRSADKHRNYALELGVNAYFGKPFQEPVLLAAIASLLHSAAPLAKVGDGLN